MKINLSGFLLKILNSWSKLRIKKLNSADMILVASHCLQCSDCEQPVKDDIHACKKCGKCRISDLVSLSDEFHVTFRVVGGGRQALAEARKEQYKAVIAIACANELSAGALAIFPKPVMTISIECPNGPCKDTQVDPDKVRCLLNNILN